MTTIANTKIARNAIRSVKKNAEIWTNKYDSCRTVKCYVYTDEEINAINAAVAGALPEATTKIIRRSSWSISLIVRLPR